MRKCDAAKWRRKIVWFITNIIEVLVTDFNVNTFIISIRREPKHVLKEGEKVYENNIYFFLQFNDQKILKETLQDAIQSRLWWALKITKT